MQSKNFDVTVVEASGNGHSFSFTFEFDDGSKNTYDLNVIGNGAESQNIAVYTNLFDNNKVDKIMFRFKLPTGYRMVSQLWQETNFKGLKGVLTIQKE